MGEATRAEARAPGAKKENVASQKQNSDLSQSISSPAEQILFLQRTIGNQAVGRLIRSGALKSKPEEKKDQTLQTRPDSITPVIQRQMGKDGEEKAESIQAESAESRDNNLEEGADVETQINLSKGHGSPLPDPVRSYMEPRFGVDFSKVRVHTDSDATQMNRDVKARAFTHGTDIYFGSDHSPTNSELTAHELTHVMQQTGRGAVLDTPAVQRRDASEGGKRMYRTTDGKMVELPPDMTAEDAARLEAEGKAAEKKLGKRPPPKPLSEVKKPTRKEEKEVKPEGKDKKSKKGKSRGKSKGKGKGKGRVAQKAGGAAMPGAVGNSDVAQYLSSRGSSVLIKGMGRLQKLKQNEQTHDNAAEKLKQSEKAVFTPPSEGQSQSNASQVNAVSAKPVPTVDEKRAKKKLQESLIENIPETIEDVDNFKRDKKAQRMGADVMKVVQSDKNAVISTFGDMEHTPPPIPPKHTPEALPPKEIAPHTANMYLGRNAIAPLQKEHTDLSNYTSEAENKLKEEDITQEQLDMVDSGDLAEANKEKKGMEKTAKSEPLAVQKFAQQETKKVEKDLRQEEKKQRNELKVKRKASLGATLKQQKGTKTAIEKQRDEVANKINGIYRSAQDKVKKKLNDLEKNSMKRFDEGNNKATKKFEDNVKREINAYKKKRYSGWFGWTKKAKDWILGMDKLPKVKAIFESNRTTFVNTINKLVENITTDNKRVVQECKDELANARVEIKEFVDKLGPALKDIGKKAAEEMNNKLDDLDQFVAKKEQELQYKLKDKQQAAIKAIDEKIEKMKEAMSGALAKLGKLLLKAAKKFFSWALQKFGYSLEKIDGIINKGAAVLKAIFTKPIKFVKNLVSAAGTGFKNFGKNFLKHLKNAVFAWLTGSLVGIILPERWDLKGIMSVVFQMLGITYQNIRSHIVKLIPEPVVKTMETTFTLVKNLITKGPMAVWEQLKGMAESIKNTFVNAIKDWIKWKVVEEAIKTILSMLIPGAGIVRAIVGIYDTIVFFIQKAKDIMQMLGNFLGSIAQIAAGNISGAAAALENGLARGLKLVIEFLAKFLHLSGITQKIRDVIKKIRGKVDNVIAKVAKWIVSKAKKVLGKLTGKGKEKKADKEKAAVENGKDKYKETPKSKVIKNNIKAELRGKKITDAQEASTLISSIYNKYNAKGLKGIGLLYHPKKASPVGIKVNASKVEEIANLPLLKEKPNAILEYVFKFDYRSKETILYVYYDIDNKPFEKEIKNKTNNYHAEQVFKNEHLEKLKKQINEDRIEGRLLTPIGQPVKVELNLNRIPCPICAPIIAMLNSQEKDLKFVVKASSASNRDSAAITIEYIEMMLRADVEVDTLKIYEAITKKVVDRIEASQAKEIKRMDSKEYDEFSVAIMKIKDNLRQEKALKEMINDAKHRIKKEKALAKVPPVGSGVK